jgi:hypothetical protein
VLSEIYEKKISKSFALGLRNENLVNKIQDQFTSKVYNPKVEEKKILEVLKQQNSKTEREMFERKQIRKQMEIEAKCYQDN